MARLIGSRPIRDLVIASLGGFGYFLLAAGTISLTEDGHYISAIWPANALLLAMVLPIRMRRWPTFLGVAFVGNALANLVALGSTFAIIPYDLANLAEVLIAALLLRRGRIEGNPLNDVGSVARFVVLGGLIPPAISGLIGAGTAFLVYGQSFLASYSTWYIADALGLLIFTPLFAGILSGEFRGWIREMSLAARVEAVAILLFVVACGCITFLVRGYPILFLMTLPVMLATFRLGRFGTKIALIIAALIGVVCTMFGHGPIAAMITDRAEQALFLQFYLAVMLLSTLPVSAELNARRVLARRLTESEASLRLLASESADALVRLDEDGSCIQSSGATAMLLGVEARALTGTALAALIDERDADAVQHAFLTALHNPGTVAYCEFRPPGRPGDWLECTMRALVDQNGRAYGAIGAIRDVTARKEREFGLSLAASTDSLTGALNHAAFMAGLDHALAQLTTSHLALIMIDIDHFKQINDRHGHPSGDAVLVELCTRLRALVRDRDLIGRLGGDEIAIILDGTSEELAISIAEAIRAAISARPILLRDGAPQRISISCGVAQAYPGVGRLELLRKADDALYQAKQGGRDRIAISAA